jgi:hypothetical protein
MSKHLEEVSKIQRINPAIKISGGGMKVPGMIDVKKRYTGDYSYEYVDQSSLAGAAKLVNLLLESK